MLRPPQDPACGPACVSGNALPPRETGAILENTSAAQGSLAAEEAGPWDNGDDRCQSDTFRVNLAGKPK